MEQEVDSGSPDRVWGLGPGVSVPHVAQSPCTQPRMPGLNSRWGLL